MQYRRLTAISCILLCLIAQGSEKRFSEVSRIDVAAHSGNEGSVEVFMTISGEDLMLSICKEILTSQEHSSARVILEPGPVLILKNKQEKIEAVYQVGLDGTLEERTAIKKGAVYKIDDRTEDPRKKPLKIKENGSITHIMSLWYKANGK
jgi:hypothetical protein